jgi:hypothetical protein
VAVTLYVAQLSLVVLFSALRQRVQMLLYAYPAIWLQRSVSV